MYKPPTQVEGGIVAFAVLVLCILVLPMFERTITRIGLVALTTVTIFVWLWPDHDVRAAIMHTVAWARAIGLYLITTWRMAVA